jgi:Flp pilus assembly protein protease CpaA
MNLILVSDIFLTIVALIWLAIASISDLKKREVANWLPFSLLLIALVTRTLVAIFLNNNFLNLFLIILMFVLVILFFYLFSKESSIWIQVTFAVLLIIVGIFFKINYLSIGLIAFGIFFILSILLYYGRVCGGADVKLLMAIGFLFSSSPVFLNFNYNLFVPLLGFSFQSFFLFDFLVDSLIIGFFYGLFFSVFMAARNWGKFIFEFKKNNKKMFLFKVIFLILGIIFLIFSFFQNILLILACFFIILPYLYIFIRSVEQGVLIRLRSWRELSEGDWLVKETRINGKILRPSADGLTKKDILSIKKSGKKVLIRDGMPYVPVFLLSILASLFAGNLLFRFLTLFI